MTRRPVGECTVCGRKNLTLVNASNKNLRTNVRAHGPKTVRFAPKGQPVEWCPGSGRPPKGTP